MEEEPDIEPGSLLYSLKWVQPDGSVGFSRPRVRPKSLEIDQRELSGEAGVEAVKVQNAEEPKKDILIHHIPERKLWLAQREAGTNEQWRVKLKSLKDWKNIPIDEEPVWAPECDYSIVKTVKFYFGLIESKSGCISAVHSKHKEKIIDEMARIGATIIGNIEERDVEV